MPNDNGKCVFCGEGIHKRAVTTKYQVWNIEKQQWNPVHYHSKSNDYYCVCATEYFRCAKCKKFLLYGNLSEKSHDLCVVCDKRMRPA